MEQTVEVQGKKYILIQNDGEIEINSFELIGASTKRDDNTKIGFFGSGLKYSIAYMMRKGIDFKVFSGDKQVSFTTKSEVLKDQTFERICINGTPTSYTTTMGPTWKEDWYVLREIYCNALDENGCQIIRETENVFPSEGKTRIYIEATKSLMEVIERWDSYFADERVPLFETVKIYTCFLGNEDGSIHSQAVQVFHKTEGVLYRKGIRVYTSDKQLYDYGVCAANINEDRTARSYSAIGYMVYNMMVVFCNEEYIRSVLRSSQDDARSMEYYSLSSTDSSDSWSTEWVRFCKENTVVVKESSGKYLDEISRSKKEVFLIPSSFARDMKKHLPECLIIGMGNVLGNTATDEVEMTPKMNFLLKEVLEALRQMGYVIDFDIKSVSFDDEDVMGMADIKNKTILIADTTFDKGRREIAMTLIEENEHILSGKFDETRAFQTHIFSQWLKSMEDANGLFL